MTEKERITQLENEVAELKRRLEIVETLLDAHVALENQQLQPIPYPVPESPYHPGYSDDKTNPYRWWDFDTNTWCGSTANSPFALPPSRTVLE